MVRGVDDSELTSLRLRTDIEFTGLTCSPASGVYTDFTNPVVYTLGGSETLGSRTYTATVLNQVGGYLQVATEKSTEKSTERSTERSTVNETEVVYAPSISAFSLLGAEGKIDHSGGKITVTLPEGTDVRSVTPVISLPYGVYLQQSADRAVDLTSPVTYTVVGSREAKSYTVLVEFTKNTGKALWRQLLDVSTVTPGHQGSRDANK